MWHLNNIGFNLLDINTLSPLERDIIISIHISERKNKQSQANDTPIINNYNGSTPINMVNDPGLHSEIVNG